MRVKYYVYYTVQWIYLRIKYIYYSLVDIFVGYIFEMVTNRGIPIGNICGLETTHTYPAPLVFPSPAS